jgi:hypothetical protein
LTPPERDVLHAFTMSAPDENPDIDPQAEIRALFEQARAAGRPAWYDDGSWKDFYDQELEGRIREAAALGVAVADGQAQD